MTNNSKKKHILIISQCFYPEQFRINDISQELCRRGYKVTVVTGIPNYPQGHFYDSYGVCKKRYEMYGDVEVIHLPLISRGSSKIRLVLNYYSFPIAGFFWTLFTSIKADCVFMYETSPMMQCMIGVWYAKRFKVPLYLYEMDLWPENLIAITGIKSKLIIEPIDRMVKRIYAACNKILVPSKGFFDSIKEHGVEENRIMYWPQYAEEFYKPVECEKEWSDLRLMFTGNVGEAQGLSVLADAAKILKEKGAFDVKFVIVGDGRGMPSFVDSIKENDVPDFFEFVGRISPRDIPGILGTADAALLCLAKSEVYDRYLPAKLQTYMACGKPIIVSANGEAQRVVTDAECGLVGDAGDGEMLAQNILHFMAVPASEKDAMSENALKYNQQYFDKNQLFDELEKLLLGD